MERPIFRGTTLLKRKLIMVKHSFHQRVPYRAFVHMSIMENHITSGDTSKETVTK
jgi:hypothetical protein